MDKVYLRRFIPMGGLSGNIALKTEMAEAAQRGAEAG